MPTSSDDPTSSNLPVSAQDPDFISKLPESLLCHILSFLPTRSSVATSVLCKRWRYLWTSVPNVEFDEFNERRFRDIRAFEVTMDRFLASRGTCWIDSFRLKLGESPRHSRLGHWISDAITRNLQELDLWLCTGYPGGFKVPCGLFKCKTLVFLKLLGTEIETNVPSEVHLPSLKVLHLSWVLYEGEQSVRNLLVGCPVLEELVVQKSDWNGILDYEIASPSLRSLTVEICDIGPLDDHNEMTRMNKVHLKNLFSLVEAKLDLYPFNELDVEAYEDSVDVLRAVHNVKALQLSRSTMEAFQYDPCKNFPAFDNLERLKLDGFCCYGGVLQKLLRNSPVLKHLSLGVRLYVTCDCEDTEQWKQQLDVPRCLSSHLKTICFGKEFASLEDAMEFAKYILRNSLVLEKVTIRSKMLAVKQKVEKFEMGSQKCQLECV